jgi:hypothetical protein
MNKKIEACLQIQMDLAVPLRNNPGIDSCSSLKDQLPAFPLLITFQVNCSDINGSTYVRACALHRGCAHGRASHQRARVHVRAYYHRGNTFRFTSVFL